MAWYGKNDGSACRQQHVRNADVTVFFLVLLCSLSCLAATIRTKADLRLWETVTNRSAPLEWPWVDGADSATLAFSNRLTKTTSTIEVVRTTGETHGNCVQPAPQSGEALMDVVLVQKSSGNEVVRESATLAYVVGAGGGPITLRALAAPERELTRLQVPRVYAFDPAWLGEVGESGYDIAWPQYIGLKIILR